MNVELSQLVARDHQVLSDELIADDFSSRHSKEAIRVFLCVTMLASDIILLFAAFLCAGWLRLGTPWARQISTMLLMTIPLFVLIAINNHAYARDVLINRRYAIQRA